MEDSDRTTLQSPASSHRLATISASQALRKLGNAGGKWVSTGLTKLNHDLRGPLSASILSQHRFTGGYLKGQITELYGPPAAGKTGLGLQAAADALHQGSHVVWIDASKPFYRSHLTTHFPIGSPHQGVLANFHHYITPTLPHLLALICHPPQQFPSPKTTLLIIDGASSLFTSAYPGNTSDSMRLRKRSDDVSWSANRRHPVMSEFISKLNRLAAIRDLAVVLISQTSVEIRGSLGAVLRPAIWTNGWSEGVQNRILLFRDFFRGEEHGRKKGIRLAAVVKINGVSRSRPQALVPFTIEDGLCYEINGDVALPTPIVVPISQISPAKRKRKRDEIANSQSEDSEAELVDPFAQDEAVEGGKAIQLRGSDSLVEEDDPTLAQFEAAMEVGFDEI